MALYSIFDGKNIVFVFSLSETFIVFSIGPGLEKTYNSYFIDNKTGVQPVPRPAKQVHYFGGWVQGAKSLWYQGFADRPMYWSGNMHSGNMYLKNMRSDKDIVPQIIDKSDYLTGQTQVSSF